LCDKEIIMNKRLSTIVGIAVVGAIALSTHHLGAANRATEYVPTVDVAVASQRADEGRGKPAPKQRTQGVVGDVRLSTHPDPNTSDKTRGAQLRTAREIYRSATTAQAALDALLPMMDAGDTRAMYAVRRVIQRCAGFNNKPEGLVPTALAGTEVYAQQQTVIARLTHYCNDARALVPGSMDIDDRARAGLRAAARRGDPTGLAENMSWLLSNAKKHQVPREEQIDLLLRIARDAENAPELTNAALRALVQVDPDYALDTIGVHDKMRAGFIRAYAAEMLACERGAPCGPGEWFYADKLCLYQQNCAPHLGVADVVRERALSGGDYDAMLRYIAFLREQMRNAV
jgi:hypothetical protein